MNGKRITTALALAALLVVGCAEDEGDAGVVTPLVSDASAAQVVPSDSELQAKLGLTDAQTSQLVAAAEAWRRSFGDASRGEARRGLGRGRHQARLEFLEASAQALDTQQFVGLLQMLAEKCETRDDPPGGRGPRGFRGSGQPRGPGAHFQELAEELELTEEQISQIHEFLQANRPEPGSRRSLDRAQHRQQRQERRAAMHEFLEGILTPEQLAELEELHTTRQAERGTERLEHMEQAMTRHAEFLGNVLRLSDGQKEQLTTLVETHSGQVREAVENATADGLEPGELRELHDQLREQFEPQVRELLNEDQTTRFDALLAMRESCRRRP